MANTRPSFQVYAGDFWREPLSRASLASRGLWLTLRVLIHDSPRIGFLLDLNGDEFEPSFLHRICGSGMADYDALLLELLRCRAIHRSEDGLLYIQGIINDHKRSEAKKRCGKLGGSPYLRNVVNHEVNHMLKQEVNHEVNHELNHCGYPTGYPSAYPSTEDEYEDELNPRKGGLGENPETLRPESVPIFHPQPESPNSPTTFCVAAMDRWSGCAPPVGRGYGLLPHQNEHAPVSELMSVLSQEPPIHRGGEAVARHLLAANAVACLQKRGVKFKNVKYACACVKGQLEDWAAGGIEAGSNGKPERKSNTKATIIGKV